MAMIYEHGIGKVVYQDQSPARLLTFLAHKSHFLSSARVWKQPPPLIKSTFIMHDDLSPLHFDVSSTEHLLKAKPAIL